MSQEKRARVSFCILNLSQTAQQVRHATVRCGRTYSLDLIWPDDPFLVCRSAHSATVGGGCQHALWLSAAEPQNCGAARNRQSRTAEAAIKARRHRRCGP